MAERETFRDRLNARETVVGTFLFSRDEAVILAADSAGLDFVLLDFEHGVFSEESAARLAQGRLQGGVAILARCTVEQALRFGGLLDAGLDGILVAGCRDAADVGRVVDAVKFAPDGRRGFHPAVPAARFGAVPPLKFTRQANARTTVMVLAESTAFMNQLPEVLTSCHVDGIFFGPYDLSVDLGVPGLVDRPEVQGRLEAAIRAVRESGKAVGIFAADRNVACRYREQGVNCIAVGVDMAALRGVWQDDVAALRA